MYMHANDVTVNYYTNLTVIINIITTHIINER